MSPADVTRKYIMTLMMFLNIIKVIIIDAYRIFDVYYILVLFIMLVLVVSCYAGCKWSRMLPLVLSPAFGSTSTWRQFYAVYTGSQSDSESLLRQQSSSSSVSTDKRRRTWLSYVDRHCWTLDIALSDLHALIGWLFHARRQATVTAAFLSTAPQCGTVCRTTGGQRTCR